MKAELWTIVGCFVFFVIIAPIYWVLTSDPTGSVALAMTALLCALVSFYLAVVSKQIPERPEDRKDAEIIDGAGELGFFPASSWWPLYSAASAAVVVLGIVFGWWLFIIGVGLGAMSVVGWVFEFYRGVHKH
ncbi:MAG: cytochrome c oxidase subunit 4 [Aeromicrobium sp.]|uniref:cytochrome c oxidase subunit 4 n=1 Tax=Aeromicrobium sp. TaxID=1871063 RepID=UPI0039E22B7B